MILFRQGIAKANLQDNSQQWFADSDFNKLSIHQMLHTGIQYLNSENEVLNLLKL